VCDVTPFQLTTTDYHRANCLDKTSTFLVTMPPKKNTGTEEEPTLGDLFKLLKSQSEQLTKLDSDVSTIKVEVKKVDTIESDIKNIRTLVESLTVENKELRTALKEKDEQLGQMQASVNSLEERLNNLEQHHRGWSARVHNIPLSPLEEANSTAVINKVYDLALRPILEGAMQAGELQELPSADQVLEVAHVLPGKQGYPKPIIMRFYNRNLRNLIFKHKRESAPRGTGPGRSGGGGASERTGRHLYPLYDDLTRANYMRMKTIGQDERVQACWSVGGQIRFRLQDSEAIRKVTSILDPLDKILR
jgi:uncharacterized protein YoxC